MPNGSKGGRSRKRQLDLFALTRVMGRKRRAKNARNLGRKPSPERAGMLPHVARPEHDERHPVHVSMKRVRLAPSFRSQRLHVLLVAHFAAAVKRGIKVLEYSIQHDHLHLMIEGKDKKALANGLKLLFSRIAFAVNRVAGRHGSLFRDRHHRRALTTPTEVRRVLVYILFNTRKHSAQSGHVQPSVRATLDDMSSAPWFAAWDPANRPTDWQIAKSREHWPWDPPVHRPTTWLAKAGWRRAGGPIRLDETPRLPT